MRRIDKKNNLSRVNKLVENRHLYNESNDNNTVSRLLNQNDGPVTEHTVISRGVEMACSGGHADEISDAIYEALQILRNGGGQLDSVEMPRNGLNEDGDNLRSMLHTLVGNAIRLGKRADMSGGVSWQVEEHQKAEQELENFLTQNPSMIEFVEQVEDHFLKQLYR